MRTRPSLATSPDSDADSAGASTTASPAQEPSARSASGLTSSHADLELENAQLRQLAAKLSASLHGMREAYAESAHRVLALQASNEALRAEQASVTRALEEGETHRAAAALGTSEQRTRYLFDHNPQPMWVFDCETLCFLDVNDAALAQYGYDRDAFLQMSIADVRSEEDQPPLLAALSGPGRGRSAPGVFRHRRADGSTVLAEIVSYGVEWDGRAARLVLATDVTEREAASEAIHASETRFREFASAVREVIFVAEHGAPGDPVRVEYVSPAYGEIWGRPVEELYADARAWIDGVHPDDRAHVIGGLAQSAEGFHDITYRVVRPDGSTRWVRDQGYPIAPSAGGGIRVAGSVQDVTAQHEATVALRESEERFRSVITAMHEGVVLLDRSGAATLWNPSTERILGLVPGELRALSVSDPAWRAMRADGSPMPPDEFPLAVTLRSGQSQQGVVIGFTRRDDSVAWVSVHTEPIVRDGAITGAVATFADITAARAAAAETERLAAQLRQAQKMEAVGQLAGGIAHDFNNLLTAILGNAELAASSLARDSQARADVDEIRHSAERAAALTRQLLAFSRKQVLQPRVLDVDGVVEGVERLLRRVIGEDVRLATAGGARGQCVLADPGQVEQMLINLAVNARDAMPDGGTLTIHTRVAALDAVPPAERDGVVAPRGVVLIGVEDDGTGMDAETVARAFEPFFTTKPVGRGTGLGLATVYGIARQSGGAVWLESAPSRGTVAWIALPVADVAPAALSRAHESGVGRGRGCVLLVEDEARVRALAARILRRAGYDVLEAGDGAEGAMMWETHRGAAGAIDVVVSDVVMPQRGGRELVRALRTQRPDLPVVFTSGYADGGLAAADLGGRTAFVEKPFTVDQLLRAVSDTLTPAGRA